jgi:2-oxoglutarate ferredoxin oxidoreductase subunit gamma
LKQKQQIILSGVGGQGLVMMGMVLGKAAGIYENKNVVQTSSYGVSARGGFTKSEVIISDKEIAYPEVTEPDFVITLAQEAYDKYKNTLKNDCILIYDNNIVKAGESNAKEYGFPLTEAAVALKKPNIVNMIALGALTGLCHVIQPESGIQSIQDYSPEKAQKINIEGYNAGINMAKNI